MIELEVVAPKLVAREPADLTVRLRNSSADVYTDIVCHLEFPGLVVLSGSGRIELGRLAGGDSAERTVRVRPLGAGTLKVVSKNCSYRDRYGNGHRIAPFTVPLVIDNPEPAPTEPAPPASLEVGLRTTELVLGEGMLLLGSVRNTGAVPIRQARVSVSGQLAVRSHEGSEIRDLNPGASADFSFFVQAQQPGPHVPVTTAVEYVDGYDRRDSTTARHAVRVARAPGPTESPRNVRVLFLAANPTGSSRLGLDRELRTIREVVERSTYRSAFELTDHTAVRLGDVSRALLQAKARIVHFAGHGDRQGRYLVEAADGSPQRVRPEKLAELFAAATDDVECVVVNACHTLRLATALAAHVRYVVGMRREVYDTAAIRFSEGFYQALAEGLPIERAFAVGKALAEADADEPPNDDVPELVTLMS